MKRSAQRVAGWSPAWLPAIRDQTCRILTDPESAPRKALRREPEAGDALDRAGHHLGVSELYWVTPQMSALAVASAETLPEVRWTVADRPSGFGLLVWHEGIGTVDYQDVAIPIVGASWAPDPDGVAIVFHVDRRVIRDRLAEQGMTMVMDGVPPLVPIWGSAFPASADWTPADELGDWRTALTTLYATWVLMQQPTIANRSRADIDRPIAKAYRREARPDPEVTLIDLRRQYVSTAPREDDEPGRLYRNRWVVGGHWRDQPYGPGRGERRKTWIASYIKGPDGAPLLETARVNVWRR